MKVGKVKSSGNFLGGKKGPDHQNARWGELAFLVRRIDTLVARFPLVCAILVNTILFLLVYRVFTARFETNDDVGMMLLASGNTLTLQPTQYLIYSHILIGKLLKFLYINLPAVNWYTWYLIGSLWLAHVALLYVILKRNASVLLLILFAVYFLICGTYMLVVLQFTMVAFMVGAAGMALLFFAPAPPSPINSYSPESRLCQIKKETVKPGNLAGIILLLVCLLIRYETAFLVLLLFAPILLARFILNKSLRPNLLAKLPVCFAGAAIGLAVFAWNLREYKSYGNYQEFLNLAAMFTDFSIGEKVPPETRAAALQKAGWSENDYQMMRLWFLMNEELYNEEKFRLLISELSVKWKGKSLEDLLIYHERMLGAPLAAGCFFTGLLFLFFFRYPYRQLLQIGVAYLTIHLAIMLINFYLRVPPQRVYYPMLAFGCLLPLLLVPAYPGRDSTIFASGKKLLILLLLLLFNAGLPALHEYRTLSTQAKADNRELRKILDQMGLGPENFYIDWGGAFPYESLSPFDDVALLKPLNAFVLGTDQHTPASKAMLKHFNITNIYTDLALKDNLYLILINLTDDPADHPRFKLLNKYMQEHYHKSIKATPVFATDMRLFLKIDFVQDQAATGE